MTLMKHLFSLAVILAIIMPAPTSSSTLKDTTPRERSKRDFMGLCGVLTAYTTSPSWWNVFWWCWTLADYGCFCGRNGDVPVAGNPVDDLDSCCQVHDQCYGNEHLTGCMETILVGFNYTCTDSDDVTDRVCQCHDDPVDDPCNYHACKCDVEFGECIRRHSHVVDVDKYYDLDQDQCRVSDHTEVSD